MKYLLTLILLIPQTIFAQTSNFWHGAVNKCSAVRSSCQEHYKAGCRKTGMFKIRVDSATVIKAQCEQELAGGGWLVIQRRENFFVFQRLWTEYRNGFSDGLNNPQNLWLGLENIRLLTQSPRQIAVYLEKGEGSPSNSQKGIAYYSSFQLGTEANKYPLLSLGTYSYETASGYSVPGNSFSEVGKKFSTTDSDNDTDPSNCAASYKGAWWYGACHTANLNGYYYYSASNTSGYHSSYADGVNWYAFYPAVNQTNNGYQYSLKKTIMMIKY